MDNEKRSDTEEIEIWKDIAGYEGMYQVSNFARVRGLPRISYSGEYYKIIHNYPERIMKTRVRSGYPSLTLCKDGEGKQFPIHILVATYFVENPYNKSFVNHKDGNKLNPLPYNLEWCTVSENVIHAIKTGLIVNPEKNLGIISRPYELNGRARTVYQFDYKGNFIREWGCIKDAADKLNVSESIIGAAARGEQNHAAGHVWSFSEKFPGFDANPQNGIPTPVLQFDVNGNFIKEYSSATEAARQLKGYRQCIGKACLGKSKTAYGFIWKFIHHYQQNL